MLVRSFAVIAARLVFATLAILALSAAAEAQYLAFVSATGVDTRPCTVEAQPCKTLQRAVTVTLAGGTVRILSDLLGQTVNITKSVTVEGGGKSVIGGITITNASAVVKLRGLHLTGRGGVATAISIKSAAAVHIEDSTVERYTNDGIKLVATTSTKLFISNTVVSANGSDGLYAEAVNAQAVIKNSSFDQNASSGVYLKIARASVTGGSASANTIHGFILLSNVVKISETIAANNTGDGFAVRSGFVTMSSAEATGNGGSGLHTEGTGEAFIDDCLFIENPGHGVNNEGALYSRQNNSIMGYFGPATHAIEPY